jgi:putative membrane protein
VAALVVLYTTSLYHLSGRWESLHLLVHAHFFVFGYLFAAGIVGVDPNPHRLSVRFRSAVLVLFGAAHGILAKHLYAVPPPGVDSAQAQLGAQVLYYGGDVIDLAMMVLLWHRWYVLGASHCRTEPSAHSEQRHRIEASSRARARYRRTSP